MAYDTELADRIRELVAGQAGLTEQRMFGGLAFLISGNMSVAASGQGGLMVRCAPDDSGPLLSRPHVRPMVMRGREMRGWLRVDPEAVGTEPELRDWVDVGVAFARSLPPKSKAKARTKM